MDYFGFKKRLSLKNTGIRIQGSLSAPQQGTRFLPHNTVQFTGRGSTQQAASLNVFNPGEIESTDGTSGVYRVLD
jgi:xylulokinase